MTPTQSNAPNSGPSFADPALSALLDLLKGMNRDIVRLEAQVKDGDPNADPARLQTLAERQSNGCRALLAQLELLTAETL